MSDTKTKLSIWWAICASFWYWADHQLPLLPFPGHFSTCWWQGFYLGEWLNGDAALTNEDIGTAREAVDVEVSYWEE